MTTPNLDALAKLGPFLHCLEVGMHGEGTSVVRASDGQLVADDSTSSADIAAALNEWVDLRATVADLRRWRSEHDCRYTQGAVADIDGVHCPLDNPCVRCQRRLEWDAAQKENAELRAYKKKAEPVVSRAGDLWASMLADIDDGVEFHPRTRMFLDRLQKEIETEGSDLAQATHDLRSENAELRAYRERTEAERSDMLRLLAYCRPRVQSYEECDETYCANGHDHEIHKRIGELLDAAEGDPAPKDATDGN